VNAPTVETEAVAPPRATGLVELEEDQLLKCVHWGFCLPTCPTDADQAYTPAERLR
jgi:hypothetical protein